MVGSQLLGLCSELLVNYLFSLLKEIEVFDFQELLSIIALWRVSEVFDRRTWSLVGKSTFSIKSLTTHLSPSSPLNKELYKALW